MKSIFTIAFLLFSLYNASAQCLACITNVNVTLDESCQVTITEDMFVIGDQCGDKYTIYFEDENGSPLSNPIDGKHGMIVHAYLYNESQKSTCYSTILLEDKTAPVVNNVSFPPSASCQDDIETLVQLDITENCGSYTVDLVYDQLIYPDDCSDPIRNLYYIIKDEAGNTATASAQIRINDICGVIAPRDTIYVPCLKNYDDAEGPVFEVGVDEDRYIIRRTDFDTGFYIIRKWTVQDLECGTMVLYPQYIIEDDNTAPIIKITDTKSFTLDEYENGEINNVFIAVDECGGARKGAIEMYKTPVSCSPLVFKVTYKLVAKDRNNNVATKVYTVKVRSRQGGSASISSPTFCIRGGDIVRAYTRNMVGQLSYRWSVSGRGWSLSRNTTGSSTKIFPGSGRGTIRLTITDELGCQVSTSKTVYACLGFRSPEEAEKEVSVHPTMATDYVTLSVSGQESTIYKVVCTDATGKSHFNKEVEIEGSYQLPVYDLPQGMYFITLQSEEGRSTHKIYKQ